MADVKKTLQEAAYVAVGVGVIGFQRAQVRRQEVRKQLEGYVGEYRTKLTSLADKVEPVVKDLEQQARQAAKEAQAQLRRTLRREEAGTAA
jgi:Skp family chaperone for outer membrane proteins